MNLPETITALATLVAAIGAILIAYLSYKAKLLAQKASDVAVENQSQLIRVGNDVYEIGKRVDGRLTELLDATRAQGVSEATLARAEGLAAGKQEREHRETSE
jgi:hypothetical protein